jgi:hypothetical protein
MLEETYYTDGIQLTSTYMGGGGKSGVLSKIVLLNALLSSLTAYNVYRAVSPAGAVGCEYSPPMFYDNVSVLIAANHTRQLFMRPPSRRYQTMWNPEPCHEISSDPFRGNEKLQILLATMFNVDKILHFTTN